MDYFEISHASRTITWRLPNRIDRAGAPNFYEHLGHFRWEGMSLILDLSETQFIDAAGIGILKASAINCQRHNMRLGLRGITPSIREILQMAGFLDLYPPMVRLSPETSRTALTILV